jgi:hypothetical protein
MTSEIMDSVLPRVGYCAVAMVVEVFGPPVIQEP